MLVSMTGFGSARAETPFGGFLAEIKTVNHKYFSSKLSLPDALLPLERDIENRLKDKVQRGSVYLYLKWSQPDSKSAGKLNEPVLRQYHAEIREAALNMGLGSNAIQIGDLLSLPGVFEDADSAEPDEKMLESLYPVLDKALEQLLEMRGREGAHLEKHLLTILDSISGFVVEIRKYTDGVVAEYRDKLLKRVNQLLENSSVTLVESDLLKEVSVYADRCDISEELARLDAHTAEFRKMIRAGNGPKGRRLDFLTQEMHREANTVGSKSSSVEITRNVVELKSAIEQLKEQVQNVE